MFVNLIWTEHLKCVRSEAWLLKPEQWESGYKLKDSKKDLSGRGLLVTLYQGYKYGDQCLTNFLKKTGLNIIVNSEYKNIKAFKKDAEHLLDEISLPYMDPCIIAETKMVEHGYDFRTFGK